MKKKLFNQISVIGLGLIGSSFSIAIKKNKVANKVVGYSRSNSTRIAAKKLNLVDTVANTLITSVRGSDLIIICTPLSTYPKIIKEIMPHLEKNSIVTDVGSAKSTTINEVSGLFSKFIEFIPAHPIAGTEQSGPYAGFPELFIGRWCIITPLKKNKPSSVNKIKVLWKLLGSKVDIMSPERHDRVMAITSHLPHLIAYNIVSTAADLETVTKQEIIKYSASGFRDFTRIASSDPVMWRDIFLKNKGSVLEMLGRFSEDLSTLQKAVRWGDSKTLHKIFSRTRKVREKIISAGQDTDAVDFGRSNTRKKISKIKNRNK